eukprot:TRINITY_DN912_c0_g2_i3.p2 TRINITY_DN912_c0_g2~~TRINITY_DN912_c0_g2_i3.p2  ORF type:complete len:449 (-),score=45.77 TRINITY_DN912_c0_g2_i3:1209-2555(-)
MQVEPFSTTPTSVFNRIATDDISNDVIHGILALIIVVELGNICQAIIYATPTLQRNAVYRYITYHRARTLNFLHIPTTSSWFAKGRQHRQPFAERAGTFRKRNYGLLFTSWAVAGGLIVAEFIVIIIGTSVFTTVTAGTTFFDPKLGLTETSYRKVGTRPDCDDFFVPSRGIYKASAVLKCVTSTEEDTATGASAPPEPDSISMQTDINDNVHSFVIESNSVGKVTTATLSIFIRTIGQGEVHVAPFRWDINLSNTTAVFRRVVEGTLNRSIPSFERRIKYESVIVGATTIVYEAESFREPHNVLARSLVSQLRRMDIVLNSTSAPWAFVRGKTYEKRADIVVGVMVSNRVSQGLIAIIAGLLVLLRILVNVFFSSFDDVMYIVMKDVIRDDCVLGPLADNKRTISEVIPLQASIGVQRTHEPNPNANDIISEGFDPRRSTESTLRYV